MSFLVGVGLMAASILLFSFAYSQTHRARPARWTGNFYLMSMTCVAFSSAFPAGFGLTIAALWRAIGNGGLALAWELPVGAGILFAAYWAARMTLSRSTEVPTPAPIVPLTPRPRPVATTRQAA